MDKTAPGRWMGRHAAICAVIFAVAIALGPTVQLATRPSLALGVLVTLALVAGAGFGLLLSLIVRKGTPGP